jgi:pimeloyl-ACP methyl ester carboxylesterase
VGRRLARFEDRHNRTLKGVVLEPGPETSHRDVGFLYLPGIVLGSTAVHGLGLKLADRLAAAGYATALFDPPGVGESEGDYPVGTHEDISDWVGEGNLVESTTEIVDWMLSHLDIERVALIGHCGGALTAAYSVAQHTSITGALLISPPPLRREKGKREVERPAVADEYFTLYSRKIFDPRGWKRLFTGESDYRTLLTVVRSKAGRLVRSKLGAKQKGNGAEVKGNDDRFNQRLVDATARSLAQERHLTVVFGDKDVDMGNFEDFHRLHMDSRVPLIVIEDTSHGFTTAEGQARLTEEVLSFAGRL